MFRVLDIFENVISKPIVIEDAFSGENISNVGSYFNFYTFLTTLFFSSVIACYENNNNTLVHVDCLDTLLEKLAASRVVSSVSKSVINVNNSNMNKINDEKREIMVVNDEDNFINQDNNDNNYDNLYLGEERITTLGSKLNTSIMELKSNETEIKNEEEEFVALLYPKKGNSQGNTNKKQPHINTLELDEEFYERYKQTLVNVFKYYANLSDFTNYTYISLSGLIKFIKDCDLLDTNVNVDHNGGGGVGSGTCLNKDYKDSTNSNSNSNSGSKKLLYHYDPNQVNLNQMLLNEKKFSLPQLNIIFSKFSSELANSSNSSNYNSNQITENKLKFKKTNDPTPKSSNISNCRICFKDFLKTLICISNKIFNPKLNIENTTTNYNNVQPKSVFTNYSNNFSNLSKSKKLNSNKTYDFNTSIEKLMDIDTEELQSYLENFIHLYIAPIYKNVVTFLDKEVKDMQILKKIFSESEKIELLLLSMKPVLFKLF